MKALIVYGGWKGHEPEDVSELFEKHLAARGHDVARSDTLTSLEDVEALEALDLIVPHWTMGDISDDQWKALNEAVRGGLGIAGVHGGMGDSMRGCLEFQWMVGGQFVGHPTVGDYDVHLTETTNPITAGLGGMFTYTSEQYYQIVDPGINVLAETPYDYDGHRVIMPCVWTKTWGTGRIFYSALGHCAKEFADFPHVLEMTMRGMEWAART